MKSKCLGQAACARETESQAVRILKKTKANKPLYLDIPKIFNSAIEITWKHDQGRIERNEYTGIWCTKKGFTRSFKLTWVSRVTRVYQKHRQRKTYLSQQTQTNHLK